MLATGGFDGPPMDWTETGREPRPAAATFAEMGGRRVAADGGQQPGGPRAGDYYRTRHPGGGATESYPALAGGERPLDEVESDNRNE